MVEREKVLPHMLHRNGLSPKDKTHGVSKVVMQMKKDSTTHQYEHDNDPSYDGAT